jgi:integrase
MRRTVTERMVSKLKAPAKGNYVVYDGQVPGFGARITAAGVIAFVLDYRNAHGVKRRVTIGQWPEWPAEAARNEALDLRKKIRDGTDPLDERREKREKLLSEPTVADLAERYMREHSRVHNRKSHVRNNQSMLDNLILARLGQRRVSAVGKPDVEALLAWVNSRPGKKKTRYRANRCHSLVRAMFYKAIDWGWYVGKNPAKGVIRFHEDRHEAWLTEEQLEALDRAITQYGRNCGEAIRLLILTGAREMEIVAARWDMFDLQRKVWNKPSHHVKEKKTEHTQLNDATLMVLQRMKKRAVGPYLFPGAKPNTHRTTIRRPWLQICRAAELAEEYQVMGKRAKALKRWRPTVRINDLRHTFASFLVSKGVSLPQVGKLLGHTRSETTERYAHIADQAAREATNVFGDSLKWVS